MSQAIRYDDARGSSRTHARHSLGGSFIVDRRGTILGFDEGMEGLTGWPAIEVVGHRKDDAVDLAGGGRSRSLPLYDGEVPFPESSTTAVLRLNGRDGRSLDVEVFVRRVPGRGERAQVSILRVLARSASRFVAATKDEIDARTGLLNAQAFVRLLADEVEAAVGAARPVALVLADVDHLRHVNDRLGRDEGDQVLERVADILRVSASDDHRLGRIGDDDFAILLPRAGRGEARQLASTLRSTVERFRFFESPDTQGGVTLSLGAASFPADADGAQQLLSRAREALDEARALGRNRVWCYLRRPRVPVHVPVFFDGTDGLLVGYTRDLSPSGVFVQTAAPIDIGMRCAFSFPLPGRNGNVHVVGRVVRTVPPETSLTSDADVRVPGMGVEFERFGGPEDRHAIDSFLHDRESTTLRPENGRLSV